MTPQRFDLIVFDWDGTVMDSAALIVRSIQGACRDLALPIPSDHDARWIIGMGMKPALNRLLPELPDDRHGEVAQRYRHHYLGGEDEAPLFDGMTDLMAVLRTRGHLLAVATGKSRSGLEQAFAATGSREWFDASRCGDEGFAKPHPDMLLHLMDRLGVDAGRTLMIGDTVHDLEMAGNAGVASLAVEYGAHNRDQLVACAPLHCVSSVEELGEWLQRNA